MTDNLVIGHTVNSSEPEHKRYIEPSFLNALPHYLPLLVFPLLFLAAFYGGWWMFAPFIFMSVAGFLDPVFGLDNLNMNPKGISERRFLWYNIPVWTWAVLWPPTLIFGLWQLLVVSPYGNWFEYPALAALLTMEAQAVFVVGHELVHRRSTWERRLGEFLLASNSYPQYATEHVYIHHAKVGTPHDVGSAPKGESFWRYFPREVVCNLTNSWQVTGERLARRKLPRWHYSNPFWRYAIGVGFWYGLVYYMGGIWAVPIYAFLGLSCVFSMKISNYFQHYGLRRVLQPNGRWEKISPRHSWSADWKFTNWMFFKMQRHADHHAMATRPYAQLQHRADESPELPGTYGDMMNLVLRPKRWFAKMDPLVDQWRQHFYPEIDDWSPYDSPVSTMRPDDFNEIVEIFSTAPRLAKWIEHNPELLDNFSEREFTDLDLPKGVLDDEEYDIAKRGLARLYWTSEMGAVQMRELIEEIPSTNAKETAEIARNWVNDKAFQVGMHVLRENLSPTEASVALSNLAEASIITVIAAAITDYVEQVAEDSDEGVVLLFLDELASREAYPSVEMKLLLIFENLHSNSTKRLWRSLQNRLSHLANDSLLFAPTARETENLLAIPLKDLGNHFMKPNSAATFSLTRARCVFEHGNANLGSQFATTREEMLSEKKVINSLLEDVRASLQRSMGQEHSIYSVLPQRVKEIKNIAQFVQVKELGVDLVESASTATAVFQRAGFDSLAEIATLWHNLQSIARLVHDDSFDLNNARPKVQTLVANACGYNDFIALNSALAEAKEKTAIAFDSVVERA